MSYSADESEVLIGWKGHRPEAALAAAGAASLREYEHLPIVFASVPTASLDGLRNNPDILFVETDVVKEFGEQTLDWGVDRIDAEYVWTNSQYDGAGVNVALLESGGTEEHPDLTYAGGYTVVNTDPDAWYDMVGHGTMVAGIVSADDNDIGVVGVAPDCNLWVVQIARGGWISTSNIVAGIDWVIGTHNDSDPDNDIRIVNMSFYGDYAAAEALADQALYDLGVLLVACTGNDSGPVGYPAANACVMAISASDEDDGFADYSNYGPEVELIAPGTHIYTTYNKLDGSWTGYITRSGTSFSCPMVVGAAALAWQKYPDYSHEQIRALLKESAEWLPNLSSEQQGAGLLDVEKALFGTTDGDQ